MGHYLGFSVGFGGSYLRLVRGFCGGNLSFRFLTGCYRGLEKPGPVFFVLKVVCVSRRNYSQRFQGLPVASRRSKLRCREQLLCG